MKKHILIGAIVAATLSATSAFAAEPSDHSISATGTGVSNYIFRGVSLSEDKAVAQGSVDYSHTSGLYASVFGTTNASDGEVDYIAGYTFGATDDITIDVGVVHYTYLDDTNSNTEYHISASYDAFTIGYHHDDDFNTNYVEGLYTRDLTDKLSTTVRVGLNGSHGSHGADSQYDYGIQFDYQFNNTFNVFAAFTNHEADVEYADATFFAGITAAF